MKTKKIIKKLVLTKNTVSDVDNTKMKEVYGGALTASIQCTGATRPCSVCC